MIRLPFAENRWSILNIFFSRRCFFIHACLWPASGLPLARLCLSLAFFSHGDILSTGRWPGISKLTFIFYI